MKEKIKNWFKSIFSDFKELGSMIKKRYPVLGKVLTVTLKILVLLFVLFIAYLIIVLAVTGIQKGIKQFQETGKGIEPAETTELPKSDEEEQIKKLSLPEGTPIIRGNLVWRWENAFIINEKSWQAQSTSGKFIKAEFTVTNQGDTTKGVNIKSGNTKIIDNQGGNYPIIGEGINGGYYSDLVTTTYLELKPDISENFYYIFEVPENFKPSSIELKYSL